MVPSHKVRPLLSSLLIHCVSKMENRDTILSNDCLQFRGIRSIEDYSGGSRQLLISLSHNSCLLPIPPRSAEKGTPGWGEAFPFLTSEAELFPTQGASRESLAEMNDSQEGRLESHSFASCL